MSKSSKTASVLLFSAAVAAATTFGFPLLTQALLNAEPEESFRVRAVVALCPEYKFGGVTLEAKYRPGTSTEYFPLTIVSQTVNVAGNSAVLEFSVPGTFGATGLNVAAFCRSSRGLSNPSNNQTISNCNFISLFDSDQDGISNDREDTDCSNGVSPGDKSNSFVADSDADGFSDLSEVNAGTNALIAGSSPKPFILAGGPFNYSGSGNSNPVVWRPSSGTWYIRDGAGSGNHVAFPFGLSGDTPFAYDAPGGATEVGVIRLVGSDYVWLFHGRGFRRSNGAQQTSITFGRIGDILLPGPWQQDGVTNPAVARYSDGTWQFFIFLSDGTTQTKSLGTLGDIPRVSDYDGDGFFDIAVYRPATRSLQLLESKSGSIPTYDISFLGNSASSGLPFFGDITGDGIDDINVWDSSTGTFRSVSSESGFHSAQERKLGNAASDLPLSWNMQGGKVLLTVVNHSTGVRSFRNNNSSGGGIQSEQWGLAGDAYR